MLACPYLYVCLCVHLIMPVCLCVCVCGSHAEFSSLQLASCPAAGQRLWQPRQWQPKVIAKGNYMRQFSDQAKSECRSARKCPLKTAEARDCFVLRGPFNWFSYRDLEQFKKCFRKPCAAHTKWRGGEDLPPGLWTGLNGRSFDIMRYSQSLERTQQ